MSYTEVTRTSSNHDAPEAPKATTADREILIGGPGVTDGPVIRFKLPKGNIKPMDGADHGQFFGKPIGPGRSLYHHCFIKGATVGQSVVAALEIWDRIMTDGTRHAQIDLTDPDGRAPTHELKCYFDPKQAPTECPEGAEWFDLHNGGGKLVLTPIVQK